MVNFTAVDSNGDVSSHSGPPTVGSYQANWGAAATPVGAGSNDLAGSVSALSVTTPAAGNVATVTFAQPYAVAPKAVSLDGPLSVYPSSITATGFTVTTSSAAASATTYTWYYIVVA